ncbi:hypothetical protein ACHBTE_19370 [Streptomyces sp. M41]|uniref:hypothetical protein n=1 Tax=Streptomyces sp. M41 TaxID=3059412 RepID=UPI00374CDCA3
MRPGDLLKPPQEVLTARFFVVGYLPTCAAALYLLALIWAGAPGAGLDFSASWDTAAQLGAGEILGILLGILLVALLAAPLQLPLVRLLEGGWPRRLGSGLARRRQLVRKRRMSDRAVLNRPASGGDPAQEDVQRAGAAASALHRCFPAPDHLVRPTALGNVLAAMEDTAGRAYGLDAVVAWPRLYPLLDDRMRAVVDDRRNALDTAVRMAATGALTAVFATALLSRSGWWLCLALLPAALAVLAYSGAVQAALGYAETVHAAVDLHRFTLLTALRLPLPADRAAERAVNRALCDEWRQNVPFSPTYQHPSDGEQGT